MFKLSVYYLSGNQSGQNSFRKNHKFIDEIIPTWVELKENGKIVENQIDKEIKLLNDKKEKNLIIPLVQNYGMSSKISNKIVEARNTWPLIIQNLDLYLKKYGYSGVNFDLEGIKKDNKDNYIDFISFLADFMNKNEYKLSLSIPAKAENNGSSWSGAYDYQALGNIADELVIMAYDYHWVNGPAGAIAPLPWVQDVIDYAIMNIPVSKICLGVPFYGYDWIVSGNERPAKGLSYLGVMNIKEKYKSEIEWDQESQTPYLKYKDIDGQHEVWFENKASIAKKLKLVQEFQLTGVACWRIGLEDPELWKYLEEAYVT